MAKCPRCGEKIDHFLTIVIKKTKWEGVSNLDNRNRLCHELDIIEGEGTEGEDYTFSCPICEEDLFGDKTEAQNWLMRDNPNPENPNNPHSPVGLPSLFPANNSENEEEELTPIDKLEEKIYDEQYEYIKEEFGKDAADSANYGWGVDEGEENISVQTKVYQRGVLTSSGNINQPDEIEHDFEPFPEGGE